MAGCSQGAQSSAADGSLRCGETRRPSPQAKRFGPTTYEMPLFWIAYQSCCQSSTHLILCTEPFFFCATPR